MCDIDFVRYAIVLGGYVLTVATSGLIVRHFVTKTEHAPSETDNDTTTSKRNYGAGAIVGKCENLLTITLILANAVTGLALIFAAKSMVRREDIREDPEYYLGGTLVNFTYSVLMGFLIRTLLNGIGHQV